MLILAWMARRCPRRFRPFLHNSNKPINKDRLDLAHLIQPPCLICQLIVIMSLTLQELQQTTLVTFQVSCTIDNTYSIYDINFSNVSHVTMLQYKISDSPVAAQLPRNWNRPYLGYNPRVDRELGSAAELARSDQRVFSDSEIYSPVFPRGRPTPAKGNGDSGSAAAEAVSARVEAMRKEFAEYQKEQILTHGKSSSTGVPKPPRTSSSPESAPAVSVQKELDDPAIPLRAPKLQRPPSMSPPPPPSNSSPFQGLGSSPFEVDRKMISTQLLSATKDNAPTSTSGAAGAETGTSTALDDDRLESLI